MVPARPVLNRFPSVDVGASDGDWALCDSRDTVILYGIVLPNTVEMDRSTIDPRTRQIVGNVNSDSISPICIDRWARDAPIYCLRTSRDTVWSNGDGGEC